MIAYYRVERVQVGKPRCCSSALVAVQRRPMNGNMRNRQGCVRIINERDLCGRNATRALGARWRRRPQRTTTASSYADDGR